MAKISARGDSEAIRLRKGNGGYVVVTRRGRLLAQLSKGSGYVLVDPHWVQPEAAITHRSDVTAYLIRERFPDAVVV